MTSTTPQGKATGHGGNGIQQGRLPVGTQASANKPPLIITTTTYPRYGVFLGECFIDITTGDQLHDLMEIIGDKRIKNMLAYLYQVYKNKMQPVTRHELRQAIGAEGNRSIDLMVLKVNGIVKGYDNRGVKIIGEKAIMRGKKKVVIIYLETMPILRMKGSLAYLMNSTTGHDTTPRRGNFKKTR